jgi:predicted dienelactone hydrolase
VSSSAGCRIVEFVDDELGAPFPTLIMYPTGSPQRSATLGGPYTADVAMNAPVAPGTWPLVVVSHGSGGSHLLYRALAAHLARHGFVVALPEHPLNNRNNNELAGTAANLANRPRHIRLVVDRVVSGDVLGPHLTPDTVAIVGHSIGGYTALALAGGRPVAFPHETPDQRPRPVDVTADGRVRALVLLAPATAWFMNEGALDAVRVPILMLTAEKDEHTPHWQAEIVRKGVRDETLVEHRVVANAGHYSFLSPFPEKMISPTFPPSQDPEGFDRARFHEEMNADVLHFLRRVV